MTHEARERACELLARAAERNGYGRFAEALRSGTIPTSFPVSPLPDIVAVEAVEKALTLSSDQWVEAVHDIQTILAGDGSEAEIARNAAAAAGIAFGLLLPAEADAPPRPTIITTKERSDD